MALEKSVIDIPVSGGLQEGADERLVQPPFVQTAQNVVFDKAGAIRKRFGMDTGVVTGLGTPHTLISNENHPAMITEGEGLYVFQETNSSWAVAAPLFDSGASESEVHPFVPMRVGGKGVASADEAITLSDIAVTDTTDLTCHVWQDPVHGPTAVVLEADGSVAHGPVNVPHASGAVTRIRAAAVGDDIVILTGNNGDIVFTRMDTTSKPLAWDAITTVASAVADSFFDVYPATDGTWVHIAYPNAGATELRSYTPAGSLQYTRTLAAVSSAGCVAIYQHPDNDRVYIAHQDGGSTNPAAFHIVSSDLTTTTHATDVALNALVAGEVDRITLGQSAGTNRTRVAWEERTTGSVAYQVRSLTLTESGGNDSDITSTESLRIAAKPIYQNSKWFLPCAYRDEANDTVQPVGLLLHHYGVSSGSFSHGVACRFLQDRIKPHTLNCQLGSTVLSATSNKWVTAQLVVGGGIDVTVVWEAAFDFKTEPLPSAEVENVTYIGAGMLWAFDGRAQTEASPHWFPEGVGVTPSGSGGSIAAGTYSYKMVFEWEDSRGVVHRSSPSVAVSITTTGSTSSATISHSPLTVGAREGAGLSRYRTRIYRTNAGGSTYFLTSTPDTLIDADLGGQLYADGGVLESTPAPPAIDVLATKNRMFIIDAEDQARIAYSKVFTSTVHPEFNGALELRIPQGDATALAELDALLIVFTKDKAYAFAGDGPTPTGQQDTFSTPRSISSDTGCTERLSVVSGPFGVLFRGRKGIYQVDRSLQVQYIGAAVEDLLGSNTILAAHLVDERNEVRFVVSDGTILVWNYRFSAWSQWTNFTNIRHAQYRDGLWEWITSNATGHFTESATYSDPSSAHIDMKVLTSWIKLAGLQGFKRVWRALILGEKNADHTLTVKVAYDYISTLSTLATFTEAEISALTPYQVRMHLATQKCQAVQFEITDGVPAAGAAAAAGPIISGLALEVGVKKGANKLPATAS